MLRMTTVAHRLRTAPASLERGAGGVGLTRQDRAGSEVWESAYSPSWQLSVLVWVVLGKLGQGPIRDARGR